MPTYHNELWPTRTAFLQWCRDNDVKGYTNGSYDCLVAQAVKKIEHTHDVRCGFASLFVNDEETTLPQFMTDIINDFVDGKLEEFRTHEVMV